MNSFSQRFVCREMRKDCDDSRLSLNSNINCFSSFPAFLFSLSSFLFPLHFKTTFHSFLTCFNKTEKLNHPLISLSLSFPSYSSQLFAWKLEISKKSFAFLSKFSSFTFTIVLIINTIISFIY